MGIEANSVLQSDSIQMLKSLESGSIPMIFADPPYGIGYHSNHYKSKNPHAPIANDWNFQIGVFLSECGRVLKDGGALYLCTRWDVGALWQPMIVSPLKLKTAIVWVKDNWSAGDLTGSFGNQYEMILFITKGRHKLRGKRWSNVWEFPRVPAKQLLNPAQKPLDLVMRAINASSDRDDLIVDPFAGSGTTGLAAQQTGRNFLLCDLDPQMIKVTKARLGLSVDQDEIETPIQAPQLYTMQYPDMELWGVHPEDLQRIREHLASNAEDVIAKAPVTLPMFPVAVA